MKIIALILCLFATVLALNVKQCDHDHPIDHLSSRVHIAGCSKLPCRLVKDRHQKFSFKFTPRKDTKNLRNHVVAEVFGSRLPFVGIDGEDACKNVYSIDGNKVENCDLKAGQDYFYNNTIEILKIYPRIKTTVHWALVSPENKNVICFEVPIRITN